MNYISDLNFTGVFSVKQEVWSVSEDKYQNTPRVKTILLKAVCWTLMTFCSRSVSDIDNSLCMKPEYILVGDFKTEKKKKKETKRIQVSREIIFRL